jgi:hypothetical protein
LFFRKDPLKRGLIVIFEFVELEVAGFLIHDVLAKASMSFVILASSMSLKYSLVAHLIRIAQHPSGPCPELPKQ